MTKYDELQAAHQRLLQRLEAKEATATLLNDVQAYIERARADAELISSSRDRSQVRANLRFWAAYVFDQTKTYPDTTLRPASVPEIPALQPRPPSGSPGVSAGAHPIPAKPRRSYILWIGAFAFFMMLALLGILLLYSFSIFRGFSLGPSSTRSALGDSTHVAEAQYTSVAQTLVAELTLKAPQLSSTSTASSGPHPTLASTPTASNTSGDTPPNAMLVALQGRLDWGSDPQCAGRSLVVNLNLGDSYSLVLGPGSTPAVIAIEPALVQVSDAASGEVIAGSRLLPNNQPATLNLGALDQQAAYLVQVTHSRLDFEAFILKFEPGCDHSQATLTYSPALEPEAWLTQMLQFKLFPPHSDLQIDWNLLSWGPVPFSNGWIAEFELSAQGGNGNYVFWASGDVEGQASGQMLPDNHVTIGQAACVPAVVRLGVTSGGQTTQRLLVLHAPYCPGQ